ncbi:hypothetical protein Hamer_G017932 [Homarus americanus]|uniref:Protein kinase domain-containing protein n=1 Tax=Homarus americanus TaxID=6706 RepID=A0A8J5N502_HOMAM|nr:hypothetical protein Hamer_G017932 [Homarus americanus]
MTSPYNDTPVTCVEARVLYELAGAGGASLYGITSDPPAIVMEFIHGEPFSASTSQKEDAYEATVDAVYEFHAAGFWPPMIHPANIIVTPSTSPYTPPTLLMLVAKNPYNTNRCQRWEGNRLTMYQSSSATLTA